MNTPLSVVSSLLLPACLLIWFLRQRTLACSKKPATYPDLLREIKHILRPRGLMLKGMLQQRADANQRLVRALGLTNTFVSADEDVHKKFVEQAYYLLKWVRDKRWPHFQATARDAVQWQLQIHQQEIVSATLPITFEFDSFVQNITLVVVLVSILQVDTPMSTFDVQDVTLVADSITTLWTLSKHPGPIPQHLLAGLNTSLRRLVPDEDKFPNPLDFVIPAWETLWRVVATNVAYAHNDAQVRAAYEEFNRCPTEEEFRGDNPDRKGHVDVRSVISEAIRLHPPSRRIGRSKPWIWCPTFLQKLIPFSIFSSTNQNADIGALLRSDIWGPDADVYLPRRHISSNIRPEQAEALAFAFGCNPLRCIASSWAPMAAGIISGAILEILESGEYVLEAGPDMGGRMKWKGWVLKAEERGN